MKVFAILALCVAMFVTDAEAGRLKGLARGGGIGSSGDGGGSGGGGGGGGDDGGGTGVPTNCGYGCLPLGGMVCVDMDSKAADGSYLAIAPSTPSDYIGHRVILKSEVRMLNTILCWAIQ